MHGRGIGTGIASALVVVGCAKKNPANFDKVKVGNTVEITYTEAFAIDVQPAP